MGRICVVAIVWLLTCCPARVATTVTRDSRNTCRRLNAVGGGCACDRASALSDVSAQHWELDQWFSQVRVVDGWATSRSCKARTYARSSKRCGARVCVCCALALHCKRSLRKETDFSLSQWRRSMEKEFCEKCERNENTLLHTCWSLDKVLATHFKTSSSAVSEALVINVAMALNHDENRLIPAAPSSWSVRAEKHLDKSTARLQ